ncbi:MAG: TetR family transcriptional regulator [Paenibacillaceae bacterium]|nr:TetR family transcriptional regulator [Paenibacillaceae bacterium]
MNRNSKRVAIVLAALRIAKKDGVEKLTLDAAAQAAGVSKGGLLHHFPNKDELIKAMIEQAADEFDALVAAKAAGTETAADPGRWSRAYLEATLEENRQETGLSTALALALFANPELLAKLQSQYAGWQRHLEQDGIDPVDATIVRLAVDGLWLAELFGLGTLAPALRQQVIGKLQSMTEQG